MKYLLCRPRGGLNDVLCQIVRCINYSKREKRYLLIDLSREPFLRHFTEMVTRRDGVKFVSFLHEYEDLKMFDEMDVYPTHLKHKVSSYDSVFTEKDNYVDKESQLPLSFDFLTSYPHELLVHETCGGGEGSIYFFTYFSLTRALQEEIKIRSQLLGSYLAVHIRHTDYKTKYKEFIKEIYNELQGKSVLLCTDSIEVDRYIKSNYAGINWINADTLLDAENAPLHIKALEKKSNKDILTSTIIDLFLMAYSEKVVFTKTANGVRSGFSMLATNLNKNKFLLKVSRQKYVDYLRSRVSRVFLKFYFFKRKKLQTIHETFQ